MSEHEFVYLNECICVRIADISWWQHHISDVTNSDGETAFWRESITVGLRDGTEVELTDAESRGLVPWLESRFMPLNPKRAEALS